MNTACKCTSLVVGSLLLIGCASTGTAQMAPDSARDPAFSYDRDYMAAVEKASKAAGVDVVWVNPPRNRDRDKP
jgi:hypothetical protein